MSKILLQFTDFNHRPERKKLNTFGALGYYRIFKPSQQIKDHQVDVVGTDIIKFGDDFASNWDNIFKQYDMFWALHFLSDVNASAQAFCAREHKKILVYDIDDNYLDVPESNPVHETFRKNTKEDLKNKKLLTNRSSLSTAFFFADALTCSTEPIKERLESHFLEVHGIKKKIYVIPNMNDVRDWDFTPAPKHKDKVVIGYSGSNSHQDDLVMVLPTINKLLSKYPNLYFEIIGAIDKSKLDQYFKDFAPKNLDRVAMLPATATFWEYPKYLASMKWDIGIAPLVDTAFTRSKSHIKWMEYSMYEIPTVASRVYPYFMPLQGRRTIEDGKTGLLCRPPEWEKALERLILDKSLRQKLGKQAKEALVENWQYENGHINDTVNQMLLELKKS